MNEVETAPVPEEKHDWIQPRVIRPKKTSAVNYMSESGSVSALGHPRKGAVSFGGDGGGEPVGLESIGSRSRAACRSQEHDPKIFLLKSGIFNSFQK